MLSKSALTRGAGASLRRPVFGAARTRAYAAAVASSSSGSYEAGEVAGLKIASRDTHGPTTRLAVVAKAGTRYDIQPGVAVGLQEYAFKNTFKRSALRIQRESELLGGQLKAYHTREALVLQASFLRSDLPYFAELLAEVITQTRYTTHELHEEIEPILPMKKNEWMFNPAGLAEDAAHSVAFHSGLGFPFFPTTQMPIDHYLDEHSSAACSKINYAKDNIALVADGANPEIFAKWAEKFFKDVPASAPEEHLALRRTEPSQYYGGEQRTSTHDGSSMAFGFQADPTKPEFDVLAALLGGQSSITWSPGFSALSQVAAQHNVKASARNLKYLDAGLFLVQITGNVFKLREAAEPTIKAVTSVASGVSKEDLTKAIAKAKFDAFESAQDREAGILAAGFGAMNGKMPDATATAKSLESVTAEQVKAAAKKMLESKASVGTVGDLYPLKYAEALGLKV